jgi:hypothetical protein
MTAAEAKPGDTIRTPNGETTVKAAWTTTRAGKERIGLALTNGLVYTNLHPNDKIGATP